MELLLMFATINMAFSCLPEGLALFVHLQLSPVLSFVILIVLSGPGVLLPPGRSQ